MTEMSLRRYSAMQEYRMLIWLIYKACGLIKTTVVTSREGHQVLMHWLSDSGERSRADGLRALAAVSYSWLWIVAILVMIVRVSA